MLNVTTLLLPRGKWPPSNTVVTGTLSNPPGRGSYAHPTCFLKTRLNNQEETLGVPKLCGGFAGQCSLLCGPLSRCLSATVSHQTSWGVIFSYCVRLLRAPVQVHMPSVQFSRSVVSDSLRPHESQHARPPCPSPTPGVHPDSCPSSQ